MKRYYASIKLQRFEEGKNVLLFDPWKKRGHYAKWQVSWKGPMTVKRPLNDTNYMLQKSARSQPFIA